MVKGKVGGIVNKLVWAEPDWLNPGVGQNCVLIDVAINPIFFYKVVDAIAHRSVKVESSH